MTELAFSQMFYVLVALLSLNQTVDVDDIARYTGIDVAAVQTVLNEKLQFVRALGDNRFWIDHEGVFKTLVYMKSTGDVMSVEEMLFVQNTGYLPG